MSSKVKDGDVSIKLFGDVELEKIFSNLRFSQQRSVFISAINKEVKPLIKTAKANAGRFKKRSGRLVKSITSVPRKNQIAVKVGAKRKVAFYSYFLDQGTKERFRTTKSGQKVSTGKIEPSYYWQEAVDSTKDQIGKNLEKEIKLSLDRFINRSIRKFQKKGYIG